LSVPISNTIGVIRTWIFKAAAFSAIIAIVGMKVPGPVPPTKLAIT
jgi:hypothetical protein